MIRQSKERGESKKKPPRDTDERECQSSETQEIVSGIFDDDEDLDPADFFDPEDLRP
jgi:hypothetical protein